LEILQSIVLGIIQGLSEFFPISSSGHLVLIPFFFRWDYSTILFTVTVHLGTLVALLTVYFKDVLSIIKFFLLGLFRPAYRKEGQFKTAVFIIVASIPAVIVGFFIESKIESILSSPLIAASALLFTALVLFIGEKVGNKLENTKGKPKNFNYIIALVVGFGQAIAIIPGISRSGTTISFSRIFGIKREESVRFSFLLSIPIILGSFLFELVKSFGEIKIGGLQTIVSLIAGFIFSYIAGIFAIKFMLRITRNKNLNFFAIYCVLLSITVFIFYFLRN